MLIFPRFAHEVGARSIPSAYAIATFTITTFANKTQSWISFTLWIAYLLELIKYMLLQICTKTHCWFYSWVFFYKLHYQQSFLCSCLRYQKRQNKLIYQTSNNDSFSTINNILKRDQLNHFVKANERFYLISFNYLNVVQLNN